VSTGAVDKYAEDDGGHLASEVRSRCRQHRPYRPLRRRARSRPEIRSVLRQPPKPGPVRGTGSVRTICEWWPGADALNRGVKCPATLTFAPNADGADYRAGLPRRFATLTRRRLLGGPVGADRRA